MTKKQIRVTKCKMLTFIEVSLHDLHFTCEVLLSK